MVKDLNDELFSKEIFDYKDPENAPLLIKKDTIIEFWVTWCPHCQAMIPRYEKLSEEYPDIDCFRIELEQHPELAKPFGVESFPTFIFMKPDGKMEKWVGEVPEQELADMTKKAFDLK
ncbi:MAG: thioredoxin family protein [Bacteroidales bacterium]|nr:thioredoxin family protein [Bacteroidales bacterium]